MSGNITRRRAVRDRGWRRTGRPAHAARKTAAPAGLYTVVPPDYKLESLEDFMRRPLRVRQELELHDADSFIAYVSEFGD